MDRLNLLYLVDCEEEPDDMGEDEDGDGPTDGDEARTQCEMPQNENSPCITGQVHRARQALPLDGT